uniref:Pseudouridylate synthase 1 homolog n=1 Tax=Photinus pyralis TaxID=7054 RepID=A0A1Y1JX55_PHOPY
MLKFSNLFKNLKAITYTASEMSTNAAMIIKKPKYDGRTKKRKWEDRRSDKGAGLYSEKKICEEPFVRIKRRKYVMLLGYSGVNYFGMQRNPSMPTIEEDLFNALLKADLITQEAFDQIQTVQFQRAARTDKGVSAARQVVSIKLPEEVSVAKINEFLPDQIRVFGVKRVTKGFNSKSQCDARTYTYMMPTVAFAKCDTEADQETFRLWEGALSEINDVLSNFKGTKNFHNFTCKKQYQDPSAKRYIVSFECESPIIRKGVEFVVLKVKGQSFMLHQIRKMVSIVIAIVKGCIPLTTLSKALSEEKVNIPRAPGLGLVLDFVHYDNYNYRYGTDGIHEVLEWKEVESDVDDFKEKYIYPTIVDTETSEKPMLLWLSERLTRHRFDQLDDDGKGSGDEENSDDDEDTKDEKNDPKSVTETDRGIV